MIQAKIKGKMVVYHEGKLSCPDPAVFSLIHELSEQFDSMNHEYHPQPDLQKMEWICSKTSGEITFADEPDELDPDAEY